MRDLGIIAALFCLLALMVITGCGGTTAATPTKPATTPISTIPSSAPIPSPDSQPSTAPMGAFLEGPVGADMLWYTATNDGTGFTKIGASAHYISVYVLPDGSEAVFAAQAADGFSQIFYLAPVDSTTEPVQLTATPVNKTSPMLSADGSKIVFLQLSSVQDSPDGIRLWDVAVMDTNGGNLAVIPRPDGWSFSHPFFSPDGSTIAVAMDEGWYFGDMGVFLMNADGTHLTRLTPGGPDGILAVTPAFSPDGQQIYFGSLGWDDLSLYVINTDGSGLKHLGAKNAGWGDPLPVGDRILFTSASEIYSVNLNGTDPRQITRNSYDDVFERTIR